VPEKVMRTVRLTVQCKAEDLCRVRKQEIEMSIGILITGVQGGVEHIRRVYRTNHIFSVHDKLLNIDNIIPYGELNPCASCHNNNKKSAEFYANSSYSTPCEETSAGPHFCQTCCEYNNGTKVKSCFLAGDLGDSLKLRIVIMPTDIHKEIESHN